jgi:hypothetical protein
LDAGLQRLASASLVLGSEARRIAGVDVLQPELLAVANAIRLGDLPSEGNKPLSFTGCADCEPSERL